MIYTPLEALPPARTMLSPVWGALPLFKQPQGVSAACVRY